MASTQAGGTKVRLVDEAPYQAGSWDTPRRVIIKTEVQAPGPNTRFVVTNRTEEPKTLYETPTWIAARRRTGSRI